MTENTDKTVNTLSALESFLAASSIQVVPARYLRVYQENGQSSGQNKAVLRAVQMVGQERRPS